MSSATNSVQIVRRIFGNIDIEALEALRIDPFMQQQATAFERVIERHEYSTITQYFRDRDFLFNWEIVFDRLLGDLGSSEYLKTRAEQRIYRLARIAKDLAEPTEEVTSKIKNGRSHEFFISEQPGDVREAGELLLERSSTLQDFFDLAELRVPQAILKDLKRGSEGRSTSNDDKIRTNIS